MRKLAVLLAVTGALLPAIGAPKRKTAADERVLHSVIPLGILRCQSTPDNRTMYLMVTAENPAFEQWRTSSAKRMPVDSEGKSVKSFPREIHFRITASARTAELAGIDETPFNLPPGTNMEEFMTKLRFQLRIFHGIDVRQLEPVNVAEMGMPSEVSYDERVYRATFDIGPTVPVEDRIVLEILSPNGERLGKFHLEF